MSLETDRLYLREASGLKLKPWERRFVAGCAKQVDGDGIQLTQAQRDKLQEIILRRTR